MRFRELKIGDCFRFKPIEFSGFHSVCRKITATKYEWVDSRFGRMDSRCSINCEVNPTTDQPEDD